MWNRSRSALTRDGKSLPPAVDVQASDNAFWVQDANSSKVGYCYFHEGLNVTLNPTYLIRDQARRIASNIAKLPEVIKAHV